MSKVAETLDKYAEVQEAITQVDIEIKEAAGCLLERKSGLSKEAKALADKAKKQASFVPKSARHTLHGQAYMCVHSVKTNWDMQALILLAKSLGAEDAALEACKSTTEYFSIRKNTNK